MTFPNHSQPDGSQPADPQADNPLLDIQFQIPFDRLKPEHAQPAIETLLDQSRAALEQLAQAETRDFAGFMDDLDRLTRELDTARTVVGHMDSVAATDEWRAAEQAILPGVTEFYTSLGLDAGLWQALKAYAETPAARLFVNLYYVATLLHALHLFTGIALLLGMTWMAANAGFLSRHQNWIEVYGLYWHFIDLVWILAFPILYVVNR